MLPEAYPVFSARNCPILLAARVTVSPAVNDGESPKAILILLPILTQWGSAMEK